MERLTKKNDFAEYMSLKYTSKKPIYLDYNKNDSTAIEEILNKLGQLEDIEDELGINLIEFFKRRS